MQSKRPSTHLWLFLFFAGLTFQLFSQTTFVEQDGVISVEAEHYTENKGAWEQVEGRNAYPFELRGIFNAEVNSLLIANIEGIIPTALQQEVIISKEPVLIGAGKTNENALVLASFTGDPDHAAVFAYKKGSQMPGAKAAGTRIGIFSGKKAWNGNGWRIYASILEWLIGKKKDATILFLANDVDAGTDDGVTVDRLKFLGYAVRPVADRDFTPQMISNADVVLISESTSDEVIGSQLKDAKIPIMVCNALLFDRMGMIKSIPPWNSEGGQYGNAMMIREGRADDYLRYAIYVEEAGKFNLYALGKNAGLEMQSVPVALNPDSLHPSQAVTSFSLAAEANWVEAIDKIHFTRAGWHDLYILKGEPSPGAYQYPNFRLDKLVLSKEKLSLNGDGPEETQNLDEVDVPTSMVVYREFLPRQLWQVQGGVAVIEAEQIDKHPNWALQQLPQGYSGRAFLSWKGTDRMISLDGADGPTDVNHIRQGPQEEWLIIGLDVPANGTYSMDVRCFIPVDKPVQDLWMGVLEKEGMGVHNKIKKVQSLRNKIPTLSGFQWLSEEIKGINLKKGLNYLYLSGKTKDLGIDRIVLFETQSEPARRKARNLETSVATRGDQASRE